MTHVPNNAAAARFAFDNTYARELEGFYVTWKAAQVARISIVQREEEKRIAHSVVDTVSSEQYAVDSHSRTTELSSISILLSDAPCGMSFLYGRID